MNSVQVVGVINMFIFLLLGILAYFFFKPGSEKCMIGKWRDDVKCNAIRLANGVKIFMFVGLFACLMILNIVAAFVEKQQKGRMQLLIFNYIVLGIVILVAGWTTLFLLFYAAQVAKITQRHGTRRFKAPLVPLPWNQGLLALTAIIALALNLYMGLVKA